VVAVKLPSIDVDILICNPKSGDICAIAEPDCRSEVSNAKFAIVIFVIPLPSPTNDEPLCNITLPPVTNKPPLTFNDCDI
jgi:hypothetical protein